MSRNELIAKIEALNEWESMMEEAKTEADAIRSSIKAEMEERGVEELQAGSYIIRWTSVLSNRFDSAAFKRVHDDLCCIAWFPNRNSMRPQNLTLHKQGPTFYCAG